MYAKLVTPGSICPMCLGCCWGFTPGIGYCANGVTPKSGVCSFGITDH